MSGMAPSGRYPDRALRRISAVDELAEVLRARVLDGHVRSGAPLREAEIATAYSVARATVRAALQSLVHEGLLEHEPHRGAFVRRLVAADINDIFLFRGALESEAVLRICAEALDTTGLVAAVDSLESLRSPPWRELIEADLAVHRALVGCVGSPRLDRAFSSIAAQVALAAAQPRDRPGIEDVAGQHRALTSAILSRDPAVAVGAVRSHLMTACSRMISALEEDESAAMFGQE